MHYTRHQGSYFAQRITLEGVGHDALAQSFSTAPVDMKPHPVDAAPFALGSPLSNCALLADEVGLQDYQGGLSEGHFWGLQFAHDRLEAKRQIAQSARKDQAVQGREGDLRP
jgi:hypothetical protein